MKMWQSYASLLLALAPTMAHAQTQGIVYDCDTAAGHFSELALPVPTGAVTVSGKLKLHQIAKDPKWAPVMRLSFAASSQPGQSPTEFAGFQLTALPASKVGVKSKDKNAVVQFLQWDERRGGQDQEHDIFGLTDSAPVYDFSLTFDGQSVTGSIGGREQRMTLAVPNPVVRIICSTGDFLITDLKISAAK